MHSDLNKSKCARFTKTIFLCLIAVLFVSWLNILTSTTDFPLKKSVNVKKIVAYSLLKKIEQDNPLISCPNFDFGTHAPQQIGTNNWTQVYGTNFWVLSHFYDNRLAPNLFVRFLGINYGELKKEDLFCQFPNENGHFTVTKATVNHLWYHKWNHGTQKNQYWEPYLISCRLPENFNLQKYGVLLKNSNPCTLGTQKFILEETKLQEHERNFTICVKPLSFTNNEKISKKIVQWIEINKILGAQKIVLYVKKIPKKLQKILNWYSKNDIVEMQDFSTLPMLQTNYFYNKNKAFKIWQKRKFEILTYNDCFYKNLQSKFLIPLDIDEIIIPKKVPNWNELFSKLPLDSFASFSVQNAYYFENNTKNSVFFLQNLQRTILSPPGESSKSFILTKNSLSIFNHYPLQILVPGVQRTFFLPSLDVQMNHYKTKAACSVWLLSECSKYVSNSSLKILDPVMLKFIEPFNLMYKKRVKLLESINLSLE